MGFSGNMPGISPCTCAASLVTRVITVTGYQPLPLGGWVSGSSGVTRDLRVTPLRSSELLLWAPGMTGQGEGMALLAAPMPSVLHLVMTTDWHLILDFPVVCCVLKNSFYTWHKHFQCSNLFFLIENYLILK